MSSSRGVELSILVLLLLLLLLVVTMVHVSSRWRGMGRGKSRRTGGRGKGKGKEGFRVLLVLCLGPQQQPPCPASVDFAIFGFPQTVCDVDTVCDKKGNALLVSFSFLTTFYFSPFSCDSQATCVPPSNSRHADSPSKH